MVDIAPVGHDPLLSFKKSEWDAYQQYVAGLEKKLAEHERDAQARADAELRRKIDSEQVKTRREHKPAKRVESKPLRGASKSQSYQSVYTVAWVVFGAQAVVAGFAGFKYTFMSMSNGWGGEFLAGSVILLALALVSLVQFQLREREKAVLMVLVSLFGMVPFFMLLDHIQAFSV